MNWLRALFNVRRALVVHISFFLVVGDVDIER